MMMAWLLAACLVLVVFQTTPMGGRGVFVYDLMAPFIVYLAVCQRPREAIPAILAGGVAMDSLSGGVFGIHTSVYLWMYMAIRHAIQYLHVNNMLLMIILVIAGIAFESMAVAFSAVVLTSANWPMNFGLSVVAKQVLWGAATGPVLLFFLIRGDEGIRSMEKRFFAEKHALRKR